jgi:hypothetical protein
MRRSAREAIAAVRRHIATDLEHELIPVTQEQAARVALDLRAIAVEADAAAEAEQPGRAQRLGPDAKELAEAGNTREADDAGRIERPEGVRQDAALTRPKRRRGPRSPTPAGMTITRRFANSSRCTRLRVARGAATQRPCAAGAGW